MEVCAIIAVPEGRSGRLRFEPLGRAHAVSLSEALLDPAVYEFICGPRPTSTLDLAERFERVSQGPPAGRDAERWWNVAVFDIQNNQGLGRLEATLVDDRAEIAYLFGSKHWGQGYAQEAVNWLHQKMCEDGEVSTLWATAAARNERSSRLLARLGYRQVMDGWPQLRSYDEGDLVFCRSLAAVQRGAVEEGEWI